ncbi:MAG: DUF1552 domain-containing protein [Myxococcota bacterium]
MKLHRPSRRAVLTGIGGVTLALPWLESLRRPAFAYNDGGPPRHAFFLRNGNGVQQADNGEPDRFWPSATGAISPSILSGRDAGRAVSELAEYGDALTMVKGTRLSFSPTTCGHAQGGNQILTASPPDGGSGPNTFATGESIDNFIARAFPNNGGEPLTLYTGPRGGYLEEVLSYRGPGDLRAAEDDPWVAYQRMVGVDAGRLDVLLDDRRMSVNDLVRDEMQVLLGTNLSSADRQRLQLHFDAVRDFETLTCRLLQDEEQQMALLQGLGTLNDNRLTVARLHMDLVALAFSCDFVRAATLQMGDGNDGTEYTVNGVRLPRFHFVSHRVYSDGATGQTIVDADLLHHEIDRLHAQTFKHLLDRLDEHGILDSTVAVWTNDLGAGVSHSYHNIPWVLAGSGSGYLSTGQFVDLGDRPHSQLLSTIASAVGVRKADGSPVDDFGDPSLPAGQITQIVA